MADSIHLKSSFDKKQSPSLKLRRLKAEVAHLVEHDLAKVGVAGSSPVFRSEIKMLDVRR